MRERALARDAQLSLLMESVAEINVRLQILGESQARLEATLEQQLELIEQLTANQRGLFAQMQNSAATARPPTPSERHPRNGSEAARAPQPDPTPRETIIDGGHEYARDTHPALFKVIDLLHQDEGARGLSVRQLAHATGVGKSWCAVAKRHALSEESVH